MNVWHTIIQCTVVLGLSPKDTHSHPNTLTILSLFGVNFWVFHLMDLSPFLIRLTWAFTFHHYFIFFPFHTFFTIFILSSHNHDAIECHEVNYSHSYVSPISLELQSCHKSQNLPTIPTISTIPTFPIIQ